jgi:predicted transcriptional regulator
MEEYVKIKKAILLDIASSVKAVLGRKNTVKVSELPTLIRTIPRYVLANYTNSDNVTNANLQELIESVKSDTESIINSLDFTDSGDTEDIIDDIIGGE